MNKVTIEHIESLIEKEWYVVVPETTTTVCALTLKNGFTLIGESSCVDPSNFDKELGEKYARETAVNKIWPLEGYLLKNSMEVSK
ncbi:MAG: Gp49 family protein [Serratia sp. (in: enterobacteria)]|uniref:Gp49 family protein n=1 Tax=Serratia sp. (in: enterobacteria) TaxID=616 RepID=UPI003F2E7B95